MATHCEHTASDHLLEQLKRASHENFIADDFVNMDNLTEMKAIPVKRTSIKATLQTTVQNYIKTVAGQNVVIKLAWY